MNEDILKQELDKLPIPAEAKEECLTEILSCKSNVERIIIFNAARLASYEFLVYELGYLPSEFIMQAVNASATSLRAFKIIGQFYTEHLVAENKVNDILYQINKIGEGIAAAAELEGWKAKQNESYILAYTTHPFIASLSSNATASDYFLFNVIICATGTSPYKNVSACPVVEHYFQRFSAMSGGFNMYGQSNIYIPLHQTAKDIFGVYDPLMPRVSKSESSSGCLIFIIIAIMITVGLFFLNLYGE